MQSPVFMQMVVIMSEQEVQPPNRICCKLFLCSFSISNLEAVSVHTEAFQHKKLSFTTDISAKAEITLHLNQIDYLDTNIEILL
jgi:hypothetical protein